MRNTFFYIFCLVFAVACNAEIGDDCEYDVDCSPNMDRNCDRSQPGGYCLIIGCDPDECPGEAACVEFTSPCPTGLEEDACRRIEANRGRSYCLKHCKSKGDCRSKYSCVEPDEVSAAIIDFDTKRRKICVPELDE